MATSARKPAAGKPAKLTREQKKAARTQKKASRKQTWQNIKQAFTVTRQNDPKFIPFAILWGVVTAVVLYVVGVLLTGSTIFPIPIAVLGLLVGAFVTFGRRAQKAMFSQAEGQPGAAGYMLQQQLKGDWRLEQGIAGTGRMDAVHRLVGRPGVVLVGEGAPQRVRGLVAQEKKKIARVAGDIPIYDVIVGTDEGEGEVRLAKLNRYLLKLPHNISRQEVSALDKKLAALASTRLAMPQGPLPQGAKLRNVQRSVRRRS